MSGNGVMRDTLWLIAAFIVGFIFGMLITFTVKISAWEDFREEAVDRGVLEYVVTNPQTGKTELRWAQEEE